MFPAGAASPCRSRPGLTPSAIFHFASDHQDILDSVALHKELRDFNNTRAIMNGADGSEYHQGVGARRGNGINAFFDVPKRATFGLPSRANRAYPSRRS